MNGLIGYAVIAVLFGIAVLWAITPDRLRWRDVTLGDLAGGLLVLVVAGLMWPLALFDVFPKARVSP